MFREQSKRKDKMVMFLYTLVAVLCGVVHGAGMDNEGLSEGEHMRKDEGGLSDGPACYRYVMEPEHLQKSYGFGGGAPAKKKGSLSQEKVAQEGMVSLIDGASAPFTRYVAEPVSLQDRYTISADFSHNKKPVYEELTESPALIISYNNGSEQSSDPVTMTLSPEEFMNNQVHIAIGDIPLIKSVYLLLLHGLDIGETGVLCTGRPFRDFLGKIFLQKICDLCKKRGNDEYAAFDLKALYPRGKARALWVGPEGSARTLSAEEIVVTAQGSGWSVHYTVIDADGDKERNVVPTSLLLQYFKNMHWKMR